MSRRWISVDVYIGMPLRRAFVEFDLLRFVGKSISDIIQDPGIGHPLIQMLIATAEDMPKDVQVVAWYGSPDRFGLDVWITHPSFPRVQANIKIPEVELIYKEENVAKWQCWAAARIALQLA